MQIRSAERYLMINDKQEKEDFLTLELLDTIDQQPEISQRQLAGKLGIALGLANAYLQRCIRSNFIKTEERSANRLSYRLTPRGMNEKSRVGTSFLQHGFAFHRVTTKSCDKLFQQCCENAWQRVVLCGISELAELAILAAIKNDIEIIAVYEPYHEQSRFFNIPIIQDINNLPDYDACILTDIEAPQVRFEYLTDYLDKDRLLVPDILRIKQR